MDFLERHTIGSTGVATKSGSDLQKENNDIMSELLDELMNDEGKFYEMRCPVFRNAQKKLSISSKQTTMLGRNSCGRKYCKTPKMNIPLNTSVIQERDDNCSNDVMHCNFDLSKINSLVLSELITTQSKTTQSNRTVNEGNKHIPVATGALTNIQEYADVLFGEDEDQKKVFECIVASFVLKIYNAAKNNDADYGRVPSTKKRKFNKEKNQLEKVNRGDQLLCFLSGPGGSGKSAVIKAVTSYTKNFCVNLGIGYNSRVVVVTAITGAAAVSIKGETTSKALGLNKKTTNFKDEEIDEWKNAILVIIDEISFSNRNEIEKADVNLRALKENSNYKFGGVDVVFAGDFTQLTPVQGKPIYLEKDVIIWDEWVHTFLELKTNHRFKKDPAWGKTLSRYRRDGPTEQDVKRINSTRVINSAKGPKESEIPKDVTYATKTNVDRMAINDGIFASHIRATHSTNPFVLPSQHTICIKASNLQWWKSISPRKKEYKEFNELSKDILHACVGEAHVKSSGNSKTYDPRFWRGIRMEQFPVNTANARTIHKLQGRSLDNVLIHSWDYTGNWI
jgi:hypothetical protein